MSYRYISLFSGAGGLDIGLERAGLKPVSLCEIEKVFCETLVHNQGWLHCDGHAYLDNAKIIQGDVRDLRKRDLCSGEQVSVVVGGPPCQAFSSSGKQLSVLDPRGALVSEFCRIVDEIKPKMFLFENVRGLVTARDRRGEPGGVIVELTRILEGLGYSCRAGLLNAADFGAYQRRVRCFILGSRKGQAPDFPEATFDKEPGLFGAPWNTLRAFLQGYADGDDTQYVRPTETLCRQLRAIPDGSGIRSPGRAEATRPGGHWGYRQGTFIADLDTPARTVTGSASQDWVRWKGELRRLTFQEVKLLQGFPADWYVKGSKAQQFKQIGNAVPSVFGEVLGTCIKRHLDCFPRGQAISIPLPGSFHAAIEYTKRDHARNKASRTVHRHFEKCD